MGLSICPKYHPFPISAGLALLGICPITLVGVSYARWFPWSIIRNSDMEDSIYTKGTHISICIYNTLTDFHFSSFKGRNPNGLKFFLGKYGSLPADKGLPQYFG